MHGVALNLLVCASKATLLAALLGICCRVCHERCVGALTCICGDQGQISVPDPV